MHLVDGAAAARARAQAGKDEPAHVIDTLGDAARAAGLPLAVVRRDPAANINAGAALLAERQAAAGRPVGVRTDPGTWFTTIAEASSLVTASTQLDLADEVMRVVGSGGRLTLADGSQLVLPPRGKVTVPRRQRAPLARRAREARRARPARRCRGSARARRRVDPGRLRAVRPGPVRLRQPRPRLSAAVARRSPTSSSTTPRVSGTSCSTSLKTRLTCRGSTPSARPTGMSPSTSRPATSPGTPATGG